MYQAHEDLRQSAEKKEKLERAVRYKLEIEVRRLLQQNKDLKEQNSAALATIASNHHQQHLMADGQASPLVNNNPAPPPIFAATTASANGQQVIHGQGLSGSTESLSRTGVQTDDENVKRALLIAQLLGNESTYQTCCN